MVLSAQRLASRELLLFYWVKTVLGNVTSGHSGAHHAFGFSKYAEGYLAAIAYRFNRRFDLHALLDQLLVAAACDRRRPIPAPRPRAGQRS